MTDELEEHNGTVSIGGGITTNLRLVDDFDGLVGEEQELTKLVERLDTTSAAYSMEISATKTKLIDDQQYRRHQHRHQSQRRETWNCQEF